MNESANHDQKCQKEPFSQNTKKGAKCRSFFEINPIEEFSPTEKQSPPWFNKNEWEIKTERI